VNTAMNLWIPYVKELLIYNLTIIIKKHYFEKYYLCVDRFLKITSHCRKNKELGKKY